MTLRTDWAPAGRQLGDFEIVREVGRGGMGVVYEALQVSLHRTVALKVLNGGLGLTATAVQRFRREAESAARLHHTNIVPVYATGEVDGTHFYAMELVEGPSLDKVIRQMRQAQRTILPGEPAARTAAGEATGPFLPVPGATDAAAAPAGDTATLTSSSLSSDGNYFDTVARMLAAVADALDYAHQQGVIHRDIKPSNLLLSADGRASVNDFGLARLLEQPGLTMTGEFVGTPAYMSPEQITAGRTPLDHRTDIYSLGATLYELLTLRPPFQAERRDQILAQVIHKEPRPPRRLNRKVPVDLETICLKALHKDPDRRYATAGQMADDLRRFVHRFAISARRAGPIEGLAKWVKRHPTVAGALGIIALTLGLSGFFAHQAYVVEAERREDQRRHDQQLQAERRQRAVEDAIAAALGGDLARSDAAIRAAELHGASTGQVRLLRGLVHFHGRDVKGAIADLEQAALLLPESVAVRALLASFHYRRFDMARIEQLLAELARMQPVTAEDFLFLGYLQSVYDPDLALRSLDEAIRRRDTAVARAIRAEVRARDALERSDRSAATRAEEDGRVARALLPDNPFARCASAQTHLVAAVLHGEASDQAARQAALAEMEPDVRELERFDHFPGIGFYRAQYFGEVGDTAAAGEALRRAADRAADNPSLAGYAAHLYQRGQIEPALAVLARCPDADDWGSNLLRAYLLAERKDGGPAAAHQAVTDWLSRYNTPEKIGLATTCLLFLGRKAQAQASVRGTPVADRPLAPERREFLERYRAFATGENRSEADLLRSVKGSRSRRTSTHFLIGMTHLADGDRDGARRHFRQAADGPTFRLFIEFISPTILARLDQDPSWPPWIPVKK